MTTFLEILGIVIPYIIFLLIEFDNSLHDIVTTTVSIGLIAFIVIKSFDYILRSLFFIKPMMKKYKIMASDLSNDIKDRYWIMLLFSIPIVLVLFGTYNTNLISFFITISILFIYGLIKYYKYSNYSIINFVNEFSYDLFDWYKIYELKISEDIKKKCFLIHNIDYDNFKEDYINHLEIERDYINAKLILNSNKETINGFK